MHRGITLLLSLIFFAQDRQVLLITAKENLQTAPPQPMIGSASAGIGRSTGSPEPAPQILMKIESLTFDETSHALSYDIRLENDSGSNISLPISLDGGATALQCVGLPLEITTLSNLVQPGHSPVALFTLYGCKSAPKTMIVLESGSWIRVMGMKRTWISEKKPWTATLALLRMADRYSTENGKTRVDSTSKEYRQYEYSLTPSSRPGNSSR